MQMIYTRPNSGVYGVTVDERRPLCQRAADSDAVSTSATQCPAAAGDDAECRVSLLQRYTGTLSLLIEARALQWGEGAGGGRVGLKRGAAALPGIVVRGLYLYLRGGQLYCLATRL